MPWVIIIPSMDLSLRCFSHISASFFQSGNDMSSDAFINGVSISGLQIFFISGAMFRISSLSVQVVPPVFGSSLAEIVPPVIIIATFGNFELGVVVCGLGGGDCDFSSVVASRISFSLIPIL